jgi:hypothetical protein
MRRTLILTSIATVALTIGLGVGATMAGSSPISGAANMTSMMNAVKGGHMGDIGDMTSMMNGVDMTSMMGTNGMEAMHTAMHAALAGTVPADVLAACDTAHDAMTTSTAPASTGMTDHAAHHPVSQP